MHIMTFRAESTDLWLSFPIDLVSVYITYFRQPIDTSGRLMASEVVRESALTMYL